jgi:sec-independent protein translocase protein TatC
MSNASKDDFFEETKMSFGDHLEELRVVLFRSLIGLIIGFLLGLLVANDVVQFFQIPIKKALDEFYLEKAQLDVAEEYNGNVPPEIAARILKDKLVPKEELIDPKAILESLKLAAPEQFGHIQYKPNVFIADDLPLKNVVGFGNELIKQSDEAGQPGYELWQLMSAEQRKVVEQISESSTASDADRDDMLKILNALADKPEVHKAKAFDDVTCESKDALDTIRAYVKENEGDADESRRLNKLLIAGAFPEPFFINAPRVPLVKLPVWRPTEVSLQSLSAHESFMIWMKAGFISGLIIASPWIFWQIWLFVAAGLYPHERHYVYIYVPFSIVLFLGGAAMAFSWSSSRCWSFCSALTVEWKLIPTLGSASG